jgi:metal-responsive CopG/Arc/MetJ family transcriptional regulator
MSKKSHHGGKRLGAGRPRKNDSGTCTTSIAWPADLLSAIDEDRGEKSRSEYVADAVRRYLESRRRHNHSKGT